MPKLTPPPQLVPDEFKQNLKLSDFFTRLKDAVYALFYACGGKDGLPTLHIMSDHDSGGHSGYNELTGSTDTPASDPGWADSDTTGMTPPDGYIKMRVGTLAVAVPYWAAQNQNNYILLEDEGKIQLEDETGFIQGEDA